MKITYRKLTTGNYLGRAGKYYIFIYRRPHGKWCCRIGDGKEWLWQEGYHGTFLTTIKKVKEWARDKITTNG